MVDWTKVKAVPNPRYVPSRVSWTCYDCGNSERFETIRYHDGDCDVECLACGSLHTGEEILEYEEPTCASKT